MGWEEGGKVEGWEALISLSGDESRFADIKEAILVVLARENLPLYSLKSAVGRQFYPDTPTNRDFDAVLAELLETGEVKVEARGSFKFYVKED